MIDLKNIRPTNVDKMYEEKDYSSILNSYNEKEYQEEKISNNVNEEIIIENEETLINIKEDFNILEKKQNKEKKSYNKLVIILASIFILGGVVFSLKYFKNTENKEINGLTIEVPKENIEKPLNNSLLSDKAKLSNESINNPIITTEINKPNKVIEKENKNIETSNLDSEKNNLEKEEVIKNNENIIIPLENVENKKIDINNENLKDEKEIKLEKEKINKPKTAPYKENIKKINTDKKNKKEDWEIQADKQLEMLNNKLN